MAIVDFAEFVRPNETFRFVPDGYGGVIMVTFIDGKSVVSWDVDVRSTDQVTSEVTEVRE